jgi:hypothetical protein
LLCASLVCSSLVCREAFAAETDPAPAETPAERAAALFDAGVTALKAGDFQTACPSLEQSQALEASLGTLLALADCLERWQRPASASARYAEFIDAVARASEADATYRADQVAFARAALARLDTRIPRLELTSAAPLPSDARVLLDGRELAADARHGELSLDPGLHVLEILAPGHQPRRAELELRIGEHLRAPLELGPPVPAPVAPSEPLPPRTHAVGAGTPFPAGQGERETPGSAWRTVGWGLGGLGLASVGVGAVAGTLLLETCPGLDCAAHEERGKRLALITDLGLGLGLAALISSVIVLVNTEPAARARDGVASFNPVGTVHPRGGWFGVSHSF